MSHFELYKALIEAVPDSAARPGQWSAIESTLNLPVGDRLLLRAPTATGKSKAALIAGVINRSRRKDPTGKNGAPGRTVIATYTRLLQDQYLQEINQIKLALMATGGQEIKFAVLKGSNNYLCRVAANDALEAKDANSFVLTKIKKLLADSHLVELPFDIDSDVRALVESDAEECIEHQPGECGFALAKARAKNADIVVTNHALLLINAANPKVLGPHDLVIVDEIHNLPRAADSFASFVIDMDRVWAQAMKLIEIRQLTDESFSQGLTKMGKLLFPNMPALGSGFGLPAEPEHEQELIPPVRLIKDLIAVYRTAVYPVLKKHLGAGGENADTDAAARKLKDLRKLESWMTDLISQGKQMIEHQTQNVRKLPDLEKVISVNTVKVFRRKGETFKHDLRSAVVDIGAASRRALRTELTFSEKTKDPETGEVEVNEWLVERAVVMMSATTGTPDKPVYVAERCGVPRAKFQAVPSPLPYKTNMRVSVLGAHESKGPWGPHIAAMCADTGGRTLVLMRSWRRVDQVYDYLSQTWSKPSQVLVQERDNPKANKRLIEEFSRIEGSILVGTASFFEGIDVKGPALSQVIIGELPMRMVTTTVDEVRKARSDDWLNEEMVPYSALILEQMMGRLIRTMTDFGIVTIMDQSAHRGWGEAAVKAAAASYDLGLVPRAQAVAWWQHRHDQVTFSPTPVPAVTVG